MAKLTLLESARESIQHGIDHYLETGMEIINYKQAVINFQVGVELLLKERLRRENEIFVYDKYDFDSLLNVLIEDQAILLEKPKEKRPNTASFTEVMRRIRFFSKAAKDHYRDLSALSKVRNDFVHYEAEIQPEMLEVLVGIRLFSFLRDFLGPELELDLEEFLGEERYQALVNISTAVREKMESTVAKKIELARRQYRQLPDADLEDRRSRHRRVVERISAYWGTTFELAECPACGEECILFLGVDVDNESGMPTSLFIRQLMCGVCRLNLQDDETLPFENLLTPEQDWNEYYLR